MKRTQCISPTSNRDQVLCLGVICRTCGKNLRPTVKFILGLMVLLLCTGCASRKNVMHYSEPGMFSPNVDPGDRSFFYGSLFKRKGT